MIMSRTLPERLSGVILNDIGPAIEPAGLRRIAAYAGAVAPETDWQAAAQTVARVQGDIFPDHGPDDWASFAQRTYRELEDGRVTLDYDPAITRTVSDVSPNWRTRFMMWRLFSAMRNRPLLVVRGENSDILSMKTAQRMVRRHGGAQLVTVARVGHAPLLNEAEAVDAIARFLNRLEA